MPHYDQLDKLQHVTAEIKEKTLHIMVVSQADPMLQKTRILRLSHPGLAKQRPDSKKKIQTLRTPQYIRGNPTKAMQPVSTCCYCTNKQFSHFKKLNAQLQM